jgi:uncharacterized protein (DUF1778 family)
MKPKEETTQLNVEIPADLHRKVKSDAALEGLKLHEFVIKIILERGQQRIAWTALTYDGGDGVDEGQIRYALHPEFES